MSRQTAYEADAAPGQDAVEGTGATMVSAWQTNTAVIMATCWFAAERVRANAVAVLEGVSW
jgi:hypothetical protein